MMGVLLSMTLIGCFPPAIPPSSSSSLPLPDPKAYTQIAGQTIYLEVAQTPQQQAMGLMYRTTLADNRGMLFPFNPPQPVSFWMKNVPIPLDIIFLRDAKVVKITANAPSCIRDPCPVYPSTAPIDQVIELRGGRAAELGLREGSSVLIKLLPSGKSQI